MSGTSTFRNQNSEIIRVLLIEDNPGDARLIREMLAEGGGDRFKLECATHLSAGLERLVNNDIGLVLLDLGLPDSQGFDTFTKAYAQAPRVPIIVLSGLADKELAIRTVHEGAQDYLVKGQINSDLLVRAISYAIERKRMEELLRESDTQVRKLFEAIPDSILVHDDEGTILHINEVGAEQLEWSAKDLVGRNLRDIVTPENHVLIADHIKETLKVGWCRFETTYVARSGWQIMVEVNDRPIKFGKEKAILSVARDITERKQAEDLLREEKELSQKYLDTAAAMMLVLDKDGKVALINQQGCKILGYEKNDIVGKDWFDNFLQKSDRKEVKKIFASIMKDEIDLFRYVERMVVTATGEERLIGWHNAVLRDSEGRIAATLSSGEDITERKQAEEALKAERQRLHDVLEAMPIMVCLLTPDYHVVFANHAFRDKFGESHGKRCYEYCFGKKEPCDFCETYRVLKTAKPHHWQVTTLDGASVIDVYDFPFTDVDGSPIILEMDIDITERKQAEDALKNSEEKYRTILENIEDGYYEVDLNGNFTFFNASMCRILGYPQEEMMGMNNRQFTDKENAKKLFKTFNEVYKTGKPAKEFDWQIIRKDGTKRYIEVSISLQKDSSGKPIGFRGVARDITDRKQAEEALRKSEQQLRLVTDHITDVVWSMDLEGNFTFVTPSSERIVGYTAEEMLSLNFSQIIAPESYKMAMDLISKRMSVEKREPMILEMEQVCKDGSKKWCEVTAIFLEDQNNRPTGIIGVTRDITERKQAQTELQRSYHKLRESLISTVNTLASTVEMKDPYTAGHQRRVTILACAIAEEMGLTDEQFDGLRMAGLIHDIGKINVPAEILNRSGRISDTEFNIIKIHPQAGYDLLKEIEFPWPVARIVLQHHERLDGSGYPQGLRGEEIMLEARILAVADVVEAITSHRPYRPARSIAVALEKITKNRGIIYDPEVVDICTRVFTEKGFKFE